MSRSIPTVLVSLIPLVLATRATADPVPGYANRGFVGGANHHIGDTGFEAAYHRAPKPGEEHARIHEHFVYVEKMLASRPATKPELAAKRASLLAYFDDYIRRDITPENRNLPWRAPVFIDDKGTICAVGYLIEKSAGRALAEKVAASHKFDYIDDIAAKMPDVKAWAEASGLSLEELASIQPGYVGPLMEQYQVWASQDPTRGGDYDETRLGVRLVGSFAHHDMEGPWRAVDGKDAHVVVGSGTLHRGSGSWTSFYPDGKPLAKGAYKRNVPSGAWTLYHPSGNIAAEGTLDHGLRTGRWRFYYDTAAKTPIAVGKFSHGSMTGDWRHYDAKGKLVARGQQYGVLSIVPGADGVEHDIVRHGARVDRYALGKDQIYVVGGDDNEALYDTAGHQIQRVDGHWAQSACEMPRRAIAAARATDVTTFAAVMGTHAELVCDEYHAVSEARAARIDKILAPMTIIRAQNPDFMRALVLGDDAPDEAPADDDALPVDDAADVVIAAVSGEAAPAVAIAPKPAAPAVRPTQTNDLVELVAAQMVSDREWPHIDKPFVALYASLPGMSNVYM